MQPVDLDLNYLTADLVKMLQYVGAHIELDFIAGHHLCTVHADPPRMEQVLMNLCVNARDAMPEGGEVTIETEGVLINGEYCHSHPWAKPERYVLLTVTDTGRRMDEGLQLIPKPLEPEAVCRKVREVLDGT